MTKLQVEAPKGIGDYEIGVIDPNPQQNYYMVIPYQILEQTGPSGAILYGIVSSLTNEKGYCYASNDYLVKKSGLSIATIKRNLSRLEKIGAISVKITDFNKRHIALGPKNNRAVYPAQNDTTPSIKMSYPQYQNDTHNNKENNKDNNIDKSICVTPPKKVSKTEFGSGVINTLTSFLKEKLADRQVGNLDGTVQSNRFACYNLVRAIRKSYIAEVPHSAEQEEIDSACISFARKVINSAFKDDFHAKNMTNFGYIHRNLGKLVLLYNSKKKESFDVFDLPEKLLTAGDNYLN